MKSGSLVFLCSELYNNLSLVQHLSDADQPSLAKGGQPLVNRPCLA